MLLGVLFTSASLDFESQQFYNLTIRATNMAGAFADVLTTVHVTDENDNRPTFLQRYYYGNVSESAAAGSYVLLDGVPLVIRAADNDSSENAQLLYNIVESRAAELFEMDTNMAGIRTRVVLDRELTAVYEFDVQVTDIGHPTSLSAEVGCCEKIITKIIKSSQPTSLRCVRAYRMIASVSTYCLKSCRN